MFQANAVFHPYSPFGHTRKLVCPNRQERRFVAVLVRFAN